MGRRRKARECALQLLFQLEFDDTDPERSISQFWLQKRVSEDVKDYSAWLVSGILSHEQEIDDIIQSTSSHWRIPRMAVVDRNILRIAVFELLYEPHVAPAVIINEAIEIAKKYSSEDAASFVNGVLDGVRKRFEEKTGRKKEGKNVRRKEEPEEK
ncbi:MAG: transcription antitermination factor NusB [Candidatus Aminicenantales bacterium]